MLVCCGKLLKPKLCYLVCSRVIIIIIIIIIITGKSIISRERDQFA